MVIPLYKLNSLTWVYKIPTDNQIRNIIDPIKAIALIEVFAQIYRILKTSCRQLLRSRGSALISV
ncbi:MAG: hypothetical protein PUP93_20890 [Rhizonema sp. NSF051]|nr:hypothetical protein [Rhizonema sp. NSF051]